MRYLAVAIVAVALFTAGYLVADLRTSNTDAQGTWQYASFPPTSPAMHDAATGRDNAERFLRSLSVDCDVDMEFLSPETIVIAYRCP